MNNKPLILIIFSILIYFPSIFADDNNGPTTFVFPTYYHTYGIRKAGAFELFLFMGLKVSFRNPEGLACVRLDSWEDSNNPHDDDEVTVYGVNSGQNNIIFNSSMYSLGVYGIDEEDEQLLNEPHGICANSTGDVYVADTGNDRIVRLFNPGDKLQFVTSIGKRGNKPGEFNDPTQVALDNSGNIYVSDSGNNRIQVFDKNNQFRKIFSSDFRFINPKIVAVTDSIQKYQGRTNDFLIVVDSADQRINQFSLKGKLKKQVKMNSVGYPNAKLEYACIDYYNQVLITDSHNHCIHKFDNNLIYITSFGSEGDDDNQFLEPKGITIYRRYGQIFIAESTGAQYYWIGTDISSDIKLQDMDGVLVFEFTITEPSILKADILDAGGYYIKRIATNLRLRSAGKHKLFWDKKMARERDSFFRENGYKQSEICKPLEKLPSGKYMLKIIIEPTYSSRTYFEKVVYEEFELKVNQ